MSFIVVVGMTSGAVGYVAKDGVVRRKAASAAKFRTQEKAERVATYWRSRSEVSWANVQPV